MLRNQLFGPKDLLCALFVMIRETGRPSPEALCHRLQTSPQLLEESLDGLRRQGLIQDDCVALTFTGLATAAALLPSSRIEFDSTRLRAAA